jgi:hypothetical protein
MRSPFGTIAWLASALFVMTGMWVPVFIILGILWCVFPSWAYWPFLSMEALMVIWPLAMIRRARAVVAKWREADATDTADDVWRYLRGHALIFAFPGMSRALSAVMSGIQVISIPIAGVLLIRHQWIAAGACVINYMFCAFYARFLSPAAVVTQGYDRDPEAWEKEKSLLDRALALAAGQRGMTAPPVPTGPGDADKKDPPGGAES